MSISRLNLFTTICQQVASEDLYVKSQADNLDSKFNTLMYKYNLMAKAINGDTITGNDLNVTLPIDDDAVTVQTIANAIAFDSDTVTTVRGNTVTIDSVCEQLNTSINESKLLIESVRECGDSVDSDVSAKVAALQTRLQSILNYDPSKSTSLSCYLNVLGDKMSSAKEKVQAMLSLSGNLRLYGNETDAEFYDDISGSDLSQMTGANPMMTFCAAAANFISVPSWDQVKNVYNTVKDSVLNGISSIKKWWNNNGYGICATIARKTMEWTSVTTNDLSYNHRAGSIPYLDNAYMLWQGSAYDAGYRFAALVQSENYDYDYKVYQPSADPISVMHNAIRNFKDGIFWTEIPGACIGIIPVSKTSSANTTNFKLVIRFKLIDARMLSAMINENAGQSRAAFFSNVETCYANPTNMPSETLTQDDYYFSSLLMGKAIAYQFLHMYFSGVDMEQTYTTSGSNNDLAFLIAACTEGPGSLNPTTSGQQIEVPTGSGVYYRDPTNMDFGLIATRFGDMTADIGYFGTFTTNSENDAELASMFLMYVTNAYMVKQYQSSFTSSTYVDAHPFQPYQYLNSMPSGDFHLQDDDDNMSAMLKRVGVVVATAAIIATTILIGKSVKSIRMSAVMANRQADTLQSAMQKKLANGQKITSEEYDAVYKATKKAMRLDKLSGGYASITTGLSKWGVKAQLANLGETSNGLNDISTLITG